MSIIITTHCDFINWSNQFYVLMSSLSISVLTALQDCNYYMHM